MGERQKDRQRQRESRIKGCGSEMIEKETTSADNRMGIVCLCE